MRRKQLPFILTAALCISLGVTAVGSESSTEMATASIEAEKLNSAEVDQEPAEQEPPAEQATEPLTDPPVETPTEPPTDPPTEPPTEPPTDPPTEAPTEPPTDPPTEAPTEPVTEAPAEPVTEAPTEPATEAPTEPATEAPTEPATEAPTEPVTEAPTEPVTEAPTEPVTEAPTEKETEPESLQEEEIDITITDDLSEKAEEEKEKDAEDVTEEETEIVTEEIEEEALYNEAVVSDGGLGELYIAVHGYPVGDLTQNEQDVYQYLRKELGLNKAAASGVLANVYFESNFSSVAIGDGGTSLGLCQWHLGRCRSLISWCGAHELDYRSVEGQLGYLDYELNNIYKDVYGYLLGVPDTAEGAYRAGYYFCMYYESPSDTKTRSEARGTMAKNSYYSSDLDKFMKNKKVSTVEKGARINERARLVVKIDKD